MQVKPDALARHLSGTLARCYFVSGDDTLLVEEACDAIIAAARAQGFSERSVLFAEGKFNWNDVQQDASSMSLFSTRRIIDVRVPGAQFGDASDMLRRYAEHPPDDTLLLIRAPRLDGRQRSAAWFKALDKLGVVVLVWPVGAAEMPRWIGARLNAAGLRLEPDALALLAQRTEGNLLAAVQEIHKLKLAGLPEPISVGALQAVMEDAAHYDNFELVDAVFAGDARRVARILAGLREEGVSLFAILGAFTSQLRMLLGPTHRMPPQRQRLVSGFLRRVGGTAQIGTVLAECALIDAQAKGQIPGSPWLSAETLLLRLCGLAVAPAVTVPRGPGRSALS